MTASNDVTQILLDAERGDTGAVDHLFRILYDDLHRIAKDRIRNERSGHTLQATALLHEAYLRLVDQTRCRWQNRAQFLAVASQAMRRILVDHARGRQRLKRGGQWQRAPLDADLAASEHVATWGAPGAARFAAGLYFVRIETPGLTATRRLVIPPAARLRAARRRAVGPAGRRAPPPPSPRTAQGGASRCR